MLRSSWVVMDQAAAIFERADQNPYEPKYSALAMANNAPGATSFEILFRSPHLKAFGLYMGTSAMGHKQWIDLYPVETRMIERFEGGEDIAEI
jgi:hypothetical protein